MKESLGQLKDFAPPISWGSRGRIEVAVILKLLASSDKFTIVIDDVIDFTLTVQEDSQRVGELDTLSLWSFDTTVDSNAVISEVGVNSNTPGGMLSDIISNSVSSISLITIALVDVIWVFRLVEEGLTILTVPLEKVTEGVLSGKTVTNYIVTIDLKSSGDWILTINNWSIDIMISSP